MKTVCFKIKIYNDMSDNFVKQKGVDKPRNASIKQFYTFTGVTW